MRNTNGISSDGEQIDELSHRSESKKEHVELLRIKENVKSIIEENEALRQGMHEILDCIHNQDGRFERLRVQFIAYLSDNTVDKFPEK